MRVRIGTSGFSYKEWKGVFYPEKIKNDAMLAYYGERLGPALFQFPPWFKKDFEILAKLTAGIPDGFRCAMEFRPKMAARFRELLS